MGSVEESVASTSSSATLVVQDDGEAVDVNTSAVVAGLPCLEPDNFETSYTWHSAGNYNNPAASSNESGSRDEEEEESWILGIDEAGRGPVLGPQVYGVAYCPASYSSELKSLGFADSKALTDVQRARMMEEMLEGGQASDNRVHYGVTVMHPRDISAGMLQRSNYSLNAQSQDVTVRLIREILDMGYPVTHVFVDPVGPHEVYEQKLRAIFPGKDFTVVPKADALFPVVSAASIVAKVTRDTYLEVWRWSQSEEGLRFSTEFGSGYPSDPKTVAWLEKHLDPLFGFPSIARQSWGTVRQLLERRGVKVKWCEEESANSIRSYFQSAKPGEDRERPALFKELALTPVSVL